MKKVFLTLVTLLAIQITSAQNEQTSNTTSRNPEIGIKGGLNITNLYTEEVDDNNLLTSFNAGLYTNIPISNSLSVQPEFLFYRKGAELVYDNAFVSGTARFKLNYLEIPVLLKANISKNFNIHFGPYFSYLIDGKVTNESSSSSFDFENDLSNDDFNKFDYGLAAGIGLDFSSTSIGLRYDYGLSTVGKERNFAGTTYTFPDGKNSALSLYISFKL
ncbi:porin family protein [Flavobacterium sp.]|uniref:porin family protein n=1 Tax=Flavobacterium sp. TaxID=239 RepID=UPI0035B47161